MKLQYLLGLSLCVVLFGCSHDSGTDASSATKSTTSSTKVDLAKSILGKWSLTPEAAKEEAPGQPAGFMSGFASTFWYEFKDGNKFTGAMSEGTYKLTGTHLEVTTTKALGQDTKATAPQMTGDLSADGTKLTLHPPKSDVLKMLPTDLQDGIPMVKGS